MEATRAQAERRGLRVAIAVVDERGLAITPDRTDGTRPLRECFAVTGAYTAAVFNTDTQDLAQRLTAGPSWFHRATLMADGNVMRVAGGMPVPCADRLEGALGVSGGTGEPDRGWALPGVAALPS